MKNYDFEAVIQPSEEPEVVALGNQSVDEVKKILSEAEKAECEAKEKKAQELADLFDDFDSEETEPTLSYDSELSDSCVPNLCEARSTCRFKKKADEFALWRRLADVKVGEEIDPEHLNETNNLMDYILIQLKKSFPKLKLSWSEYSWNNTLLINGCETRISMEKLALAYQGLINITDELNAQASIAKIVNRKLKELFI